MLHNLRYLVFQNTQKCRQKKEKKNIQLTDNIILQYLHDIHKILRSERRDFISQVERIGDVRRQLVQVFFQQRFGGQDAIRVFGIYSGDQQPLESLQEAHAGRGRDFLGGHFALIAELLQAELRNKTSVPEDK